MGKKNLPSFAERLEAYRKTYEIDEFTNPNDVANLHVIIANQQLIDKFQDAVDAIMEDEDFVDRIGDIKKLQDTRQNLIEQNMSIERILGIDRKSRKKDTQESVADYIQFLKTSAKEFLEQQLITVSCPQCKILLGRILPVHEHTEFDVSFQCSQCKRYGTATRKERDIFFDLKEKRKEWRKKYPIEIIQPRFEIIESEDDVVLEEEEEEDETLGET